MTELKELLPYIITGITIGSIYSMAAVGLVLTFKTSGIFNFAHGAQAAVAAYVFYEFYERNDIAWPLAALLTFVLVGFIGGLVLERLAAGLSGAPTAARVAATIGLLVGVQAELENIFGSESLIIKFFLPTDPIEVPGINLPNGGPLIIRADQIIVTFLALFLTLGLYWFLKTRRLGVAIQASIEDPALLASKGINPVTVRRYAWIIGSCFATISGILLAPVTSLNSSTLTLLVFYAFGAAALGMFDNLLLTHLGGLAIGIGASVLRKYITGGGALAGLPASLPFILLFLALALAPKGRLRERGLELVRRPLPSVKSDRAVSPWVLAAVGLGALSVLPHLVDAGRVSLYASSLGFVVIFASLALLVRVSGQISLCQMTFAGIGAATFGHAMSGGFPWPIAVLLAGLAALPAGAAVAIPAFRLSGLYLAMATFGFALLVRDVFFFTPWMFGTQRDNVLEAPRPELGGIELGTDIGYYYVVLAVALLCVLLTLAVSRGRLGRILRAMADAPEAVDAHGANTNVSKFLVFCISAFVAGIGGAVLSPVSGSINSLSYSPFVSLILVAVLFIAGRHPVLGLFIAGAMYVLPSGYISNQDIQQYIPVSFGVFAVVAAILVARPIKQPLLDRLHQSKRLAAHRLGRNPEQARIAHFTEAAG